MATEATADAETHDCPESHCRLSFPSERDVLSHLQWDHHYSELDARRAMMDV